MDLNYDDLYNFSLRIKEERLKLHLTQEALSKKLGFAHNYINQLERAKRNPSVNALICLSEFFGVSTDYLLKGYQQTICDNLEIVSSKLTKEEREYLAQAISKLIEHKDNTEK